MLCIAQPNGSYVILFTVAILLPIQFFTQTTR